MRRLSRTSLTDLQLDFTNVTKVTASRINAFSCLLPFGKTKSVKEVLKQAKNADDERSVFIIKNIFQPVYERYISALSDSNQIDFTDAILQATEICRTSYVIFLSFANQAGTRLCSSTPKCSK